MALLYHVKKMDEVIETLQTKLVNLGTKILLSLNENALLTTDQHEKAITMLNERVKAFSSPEILGLVMLLATHKIEVVFPSANEIIDSIKKVDVFELIAYIEFLKVYFPDSKVPELTMESLSEFSKNTVTAISDEVQFDKMKKLIEGIGSLINEYHILFRDIMKIDEKQVSIIKLP